MKTQTRHPLTIKYTVMVPDDVIDNIKESDGTRYWALHSGDFALREDDSNGELYLWSYEDSVRHYYDTKNCLRGIALWIQNGGDFRQLLDMDTDIHDHDHIWQYAFLGGIVYG